MQFYALYQFRLTSFLEEGTSQFHNRKLDGEKVVGKGRLCGALVLLLGSGEGDADLITRTVGVYVG